MHHPHTLRLAAWARLVGLALLIGLGLLASLGLTTRTAHAATTTITSCDESHLDSAITSAASGDTISFGCDGTITLSSTLTISKNLTLDGNGHRVTLDGNNSVQVLSVNSGVSFTLNALTIAHGLAFNGGGLYNGGTLSISNSTFANNSASGKGGGIRNDATLSISNSTFSGNSAGDVGGGIRNEGTLSISNSTFANGSAFFGGGLSNKATVNIGGSIVANNRGGNCSMFEGTLNDQGYNLDSDGRCFTASTSLHTNPLLAGLADNGGSTQTQALQQGSPAIDQIPAASCPKADQRGVTRPDDNETACDIGAYESSYDDDLGLINVPSNITVNATSPQGASVTYPTPTATDESGDSSTASVNCTPASGSTFPIGTTKVTCTATDSDDTNSPVSASFTVTVNDTDLGLSNLPSNITTDATSPQGAKVTYTPPTVVDEDSPLPSASCTPASGSTFPIGTTRVTCTASDSDDTNSPVNASFTVTVNDTDLGFSNVPANITTNATSSQGAVVTYTSPTAVDEDSPLPPVNCSPASGSTFPVGVTKVTCTMSDSDDTPSSVTASFTVTVTDTDLGLSNVPASITTDATRPQGATVTYTPPTAVDEDSPLPTVTCDHASGSTFAIGTTTVTCTVSDSEDTPSSVRASFTVTVKGAAAQVSDLINLVNSFGLPADFQASFDTQLQAVQTDLTNNNPTQACRDLTAFINHVQAQSGKGLTTSQANQLIAAAKQVQAVLGC
ncbi:MAG TPA: HYR domain-containing protein [Ktedonobacteraceae bacterium]